MQKELFIWIYTLKVIAIILITNSHFKPIYDSSFSQFAFGGAMGCAIFFFCSGYTMANIKTESFVLYIKKRILRIIPPLWIFLGLIYNSTNWKNYLLFDSYWFLQAIIVFYIFFYFIIKYIKDYMFYIIILLIISFIICYFASPHDKWVIDYPKHPLHITWFYYFAIMILGAYLRLHENNKSNKIFVLLSIISFLVLYGIKFIGLKYENIIDIQLLFPFILILTTILIYKASQYIDFDNCKYINNIILFLQKYTLEIYITQFICINICSKLPYSILRFVTVVPLIIISAFLLNKLSIFILNKLRIV